MDVDFLDTTGLKQHIEKYSDSISLELRNGIKINTTELNQKSSINHPL